MADAALITVDWGTTSLRCSALAADGAVVDRREGGPGILAVSGGGFEIVLRNEIAAWASRWGRLPCVLSGMIGSRQGWVEVPYLACPAHVSAVAGKLHRHQSEGLGTLYFVPGLSCDLGGAMPDVMRGEETQVFGALAGDTTGQGAADGLFVLPGTHSKWVTVAGGAITAFETYMTGEVFAALRHHTILGRLMTGDAGRLDADGFRAGVRAGATDGPAGALLHRLFGTRTLGLFDRLQGDALESYLSGLLVGAEMTAAMAARTDQARSFTIIGSAALGVRYREAASVLGMDARLASFDCASRGAWMLADAAGLLKERHL